VTFCYQCGYQLALGIEKFCPNCGTDLQQQKTAAIGGRMTDDNRSVGIQQTGGDVVGTGISGSGNITAKDTKGNIFYFNIGSISPEQLKGIITASTTLATSQAPSTDNNTNAKNLQMVTETKQQTGQFLEEISRIEREEGKEIQEIKVGEVQISKNELSLKEIILKGNEHYYNKEYNEAIKYYDKALEIDPKYALAWNNKGVAVGKLEKYNEAIGCYDKALEIDPKDADEWYNKGNALHDLGKYKEAIECYDKALEIDAKDAYAVNNIGLALNKLQGTKSEQRKIRSYTSDGKPVYE
jgi:tetratricopeptide (TPR) repeat protein